MPGVLKLSHKLYELDLQKTNLPEERELLVHVLVITLDQNILQSLDIPHNICWKDKSIVVEMKCIF